MQKFMFSFLIRSKAIGEKTGFGYFLCFCFINKHSCSLLFQNFAFLKWKQHLQLRRAVYRRVCTYLFCGRQYSFSSHRKKSTLFLSTCKSVSHWSLGRLLQATCSSSWHTNVTNWAISLSTVHSRLLQRLSVMVTLTPQEKLSPTRVPPTCLR